MPVLLPFPPPSSSLPVSAPGSFGVTRRRGVWWFTRPDGRPFYSLGVCCVERGATRETYNPANPGYAAWRHYASPEEWAHDTVDRLKRWGFTTIGGWSDYHALRAVPEPLPMAPVLHAGSTAGIPWTDMWDPAVLARVESTAGEVIKPLRDDPNVLGYYSDNELGWWYSTLFRMTLEMPAASGQRRRVLGILKRHYGGSWGRLLEDFDPEGAGGFDQLDAGGALYVRPGGQGARVQRKVLAFLADRYYAVVSRAIRALHPGALFLGDRYQSFYMPEVARASRRYVDVVSTNHNAHWVDGSFARYYLATLHELTGKPVTVGEFYMAATENRSGNRNTSAGFPVVPTQAERATGFTRTAREIARLPFMVGSDWFQYYDEPTHGRGDGEDYNMGLVDIHNAPYEDITAAAGALHLDEAHARAADAALAPPGVPPAPRDPMADFTPMHAIVHWDREGGWVPPSTRAPVADLYACWHADALYLATHASGFVEESAYRDGKVPECDRSLWTLRVGKTARTVRVRLGSGRPAACDDPDVAASTPPGGDADVRILAVARIPAHVLGLQRLEAGTRIPVDVQVETAGRCDRVRWRRTLTLQWAPRQ